MKWTQDKKAYCIGCGRITDYLIREIEEYNIFCDECEKKYEQYNKDSWIGHEEE